MDVSLFLLEHCLARLKSMPVTSVCFLGESFSWGQDFANPESNPRPLETETPWGPVPAAPPFGAVAPLPSAVAAHAVVFSPP